MRRSGHFITAVKRKSTMTCLHMDQNEKIAETVQNGKGDKRRVPWSKDYATNFDRIFKKEKKNVGRKPDKKGAGTVLKRKQEL